MNSIQNVVTPSACEYIAKQVYDYCLEPIGSVLEAILSLGAEAKATKEALHARDKLGVVQHGAGVAKGINDIARYPLTALEKGFEFLSAAWKSMPNLDPNFVHFLSGLKFVEAIAALGVVTNTLGLVWEAPNLYRQTKLWEKLPQNFAEPGKAPEEILKDLQELGNRKTDVQKEYLFLQSLPEYLSEQIQSFESPACINEARLSDEDSLSNSEGDSSLEESYGYTGMQGFFNDLQLNDPTSAKTKTFIKQIHQGAVRKSITHFLGVLSCVFGLAASLGVIVAKLVLVAAVIYGLSYVWLALAIASILFLIVAYVMKTAWVENPGDGFDWKLLEPESMRNPVQREFKKFLNTRVY